MIYILHSITQVGADVWFEMYNGVHGNGKSPAEWNPEYFSIHPMPHAQVWPGTTKDARSVDPRHPDLYWETDEVRDDYEIAGPGDHWEDD